MTVIKFVSVKKTQNNWKCPDAQFYKRKREDHTQLYNVRKCNKMNKPSVHRQILLHCILQNSLSLKNLCIFHTTAPAFIKTITFDQSYHHCITIRIIYDNKTYIYRSHQLMHKFLTTVFLLALVKVKVTLSKPIVKVCESNLSY